MPKVENSYVVADKRFRFYRKNLFTFNYVAGNQATEELSALPAGEYLVGLFFEFFGVYRQDGNGSDAVDHMHLLDVLDNIEITNGNDTHLRLGMPQIAQHYKMQTGQNPMLPDDIAASATASNVDTTFGFIVPFMYANPAFKRMDDFSYPTSLLQDGNLTCHWNNTASLNGDAVSAMQSGTLTIHALTARLNRAVIPPEQSVGYISTSDDFARLAKGNYVHAWATGFTKTNKLTQTSLYLDADGMDVIASGTRVDELEGQAAHDLRYCDDEQQIPYRGDLIDKNIPPIPTGDYAYHMFPLYFGSHEQKMAKILRVEHALNIQLTTTGSIAKRICWYRFANHSESGLDIRAKILGFGRDSDAVPRTNRRGLNPGDASLANLLPARLVQRAP